MATSLQSLQRFATLTRQSELTEVRAAVAAVIKDLKGSVEKTREPAKARRSIADLLGFLNSLNATIHPGRAELAQAISRDIIPLLYKNQPEQTSEVDDYQYLQPEYLLVNYLSSVLGDHLALLRGELEDHPGFRKGKRQDVVQPICVLAPAFVSGLRDLLTSLAVTRLRTKKIETSIYEPLQRDYLRQGRNSAKFFDEQQAEISDEINKHLAWAETIEDNLRQQARKTSSATEAENPDEAVNHDEDMIQELLDKLKLHSEKHDYFLPRVAGFRLIAKLFNLAKPEIAKAIKQLHDATRYSENHTTVVQQLDELVSNFDEYDFDLIALSAHRIGEKTACLSPKALQDACIGSGRTTETMIQARPLVAAELGRLPIHLAKKIREIVGQDHGDLDDIQTLDGLFEHFRSNIHDINKTRFEAELKSCSGIFYGSKVLTPLGKWLESEGAQEGTFFLRMQQVQISLKKKWGLT
ncbi:hypothetical protein O4H49_02295 [Kiloniella laminariae]|uniref:Uncharacterized protein n=1 Tax=Kiloniella laminariae TaxID=454162 RepID=A0ABT4LES0_9PROT|nr:hypothetical protein [Kiloniella laminariae]MCZ4279590.1 hypothetical protein [Kiloniella laminariae]